LKSNFIIISVGLHGEILGFFLELRVLGCQTQETVEETHRVLEVAHFFRLGLFAHKALFRGIADIIASLAVRPFIGQDVDTTACGGAEY